MCCKFGPRASAWLLLPLWWGPLLSQSFHSGHVRPHQLWLHAFSPVALAFLRDAHQDPPVSACRPMVLTQQLAACPSGSLRWWPMAHLAPECSQGHSCGTFLAVGLLGPRMCTVAATW